jgi:hypothetical protein
MRRSRLQNAKRRRGMPAGVEIPNEVKNVSAACDAAVRA